MAEASIFNYNIGYMGFAMFKSIPILATSGNFTFSHTPIYSNCVYGADPLNAVNHITFAPDYPQVNADIDFELTVGLTDQSIFKQFGDSITIKRFNSNEVLIYPNGVAGYKSDMYTQSLQYNTSQNNLVTGNIKFKSTGINSSISASSNYHILGSTSELGHLTDGQNKVIDDIVGSKYMDVFPYYGSKIQFGNTKKDLLYRNRQSTTSASSLNLTTNITSWNINISQQISFVKLCSCFCASMKTLKADYACFGLQNASGGLQAYGIYELFKDAKTFYLFDDKTTISLISANSNKTHTITMQKLQCTNINSQLHTNDDFISTSMDFQVLGNPSQTSSFITFT